MNDKQSWLEHLRRIAPPTGVLVAGSGIGGWVKPLMQWNVPSVLFAEADAAQIDRMKKAYSLPEHWRVSQSLLWNEEAKLDFHRASNPAASSVMPPDSFTQLWPNLTESGRELCQAETIDRLLDAGDGAAYNWYIIDCLPALPVLRGAEAKIAECDVVLARVLADSAALPEAETGKTEVGRWLGERGFRLIALFDEDHPDVSLVLYMRDWKEKASREKLRTEDVTLEKETLLTQAKALTEDNAAKSSLIEEQKMRIEALQSRLDTAIKEHEETANIALEAQSCVENMNTEQERTLSENTELKAKVTKAVQDYERKTKEYEQILEDEKQKRFALQEDNELLKQQVIEKDEVNRLQQIEFLNKEEILHQEYEKKILIAKEQVRDFSTKKWNARVQSFIPLEQYIALNQGYRKQWQKYLEAMNKEELAVKINILNKGMDQESRQLVEYHLSSVRAVCPNSMLSYFFVKGNLNKDLLPKKALARLEKYEYFSNQKQQLEELQKQLQLLELPLAELLVHCGLKYIEKTAKSRLHNSTIIDAGAYTGDTARMFYEFYSPENVIALEPHPQTYEKLSKQITEWKLEGKIIPSQVATGGKTGQMKIWGEGLGASKIKKTTLEPIASLQVNLNTIDKIVETQNIKNIGLIKLDVEGNEFSSIKGAKKCIKKYKPILLISLYHTAKDFFEIKPMIEEMDLDYKFMIRKVTDEAIKEIILIAY